MFVFAKIVSFVKILEKTRRGNGEQRHAVVSSSALAPRLYLAAYSPSSPVVLGPSVLQFISTACHRDSISLLLNHRNLIFETACVFTPFSSAFAFPIEMDFSFESQFAIWSSSSQRFKHYFSPEHRFLAVSEILNRSDICAGFSLCNTVGFLILFKLCLAFTFLQQLVTNGLKVIHTYTCSPRDSIDVIVSAPDDPCIC